MQNVIAVTDTRSQRKHTLTCVLQLAITRACHAVITLFICYDLRLCWLLQQHCSTCYSYKSKTLYGDLIKRGCLGVILPPFGCSFHPYTGVIYPRSGWYIRTPKKLRQSSCNNQKKSITRSADRVIGKL